MNKADFGKGQGVWQGTRQSEILCPGWKLLFSCLEYNYGYTAYQVLFGFCLNLGFWILNFKLSVEHQDAREWVRCKAGSGPELSRWDARPWFDHAIGVTHRPEPVEGESRGTPACFKGDKFCLTPFEKLLFSQRATEDWQNWLPGPNQFPVFSMDLAAIQTSGFNAARVTALSVSLFLMVSAMGSPR